MRSNVKSWIGMKTVRVKARWEGESQHKAVLEHPDLGTIIWTLGEYPVGVPDYRETNPGEHTILQDFAYGLEHEPEPPAPGER